MPDANYLAAAADGGLDVLYVLTGRRESNTTALSHLPPAQPVSPDTTRSGAPPLGGTSGRASAGLLVVVDGERGPPLRLSVGISGGREMREYQVIPKSRADAAAGRAGAGGAGEDGPAIDVAGVLAIECEYMRRALGRNGPGFITVTVSGDSMEPTLGDGDVIIVDTARTAIDASGIYVVELAGDLLVKRVQRRMDGSLVLKSDNAAYDPEHIQAGAAHTLRVLGRMTRLRFR